METDTLPEGLKQAILLPLIVELLPFVSNDNVAAREAAEAATMCLNPQNPNEFRLAARVALFNILGNRLTAAASAPSLTPACSLRMRNCALSHIREADKAERRLEKLQAARPEKGKQKPETTQAEPAPIPAKQTATPAPQSRPQPNIPAYKQLKQERRLTKQRERDERLKAEAKSQGQPQTLPFAA